MEIHAKNLAEAWESSILELLRENVPYVYTQRGTRAKEILAMQMTVDSPLSEPLLSGKYAFGETFVEKYCQSILEASCGEQSIHTRIVREKSISRGSNNQIKRVENLLRSQPESRRAVVSLWDAESDMTSVHPPCACTIQFLIRENKLDVVAYFRSNDSWMAVPPDMVAMVKLGALVADNLKIPFGRYAHIAASYHMYEPDIVPAKITMGV